MIKRIITLILTLALALSLCAPIAALSYKTNVYRYEDYTYLTRGDQSRLQNDTHTYTDNNGLRVYECDEKIYYCVALSQDIGTHIGSTWSVTLDNGNKFDIILGDCKGHNKHKLGDICKNINGEEAINVIEFIVETDALPKKVKNWGSVSGMDFFDGNIKTMVYTGRIWD